HRFVPRPHRNARRQPLPLPRPLPGADRGGVLPLRAGGSSRPRHGHGAVHLQLRPHRSDAVRDLHRLHQRLHRQHVRGNGGHVSRPPSLPPHPPPPPPPRGGGCLLGGGRPHPPPPARPVVAGGPP